MNDFDTSVEDFFTGLVIGMITSSLFWWAVFYFIGSIS